ALEVRPGMQALVAEHLDSLAQRPVPPILKLAVLHLLEDETLQLITRVTGSDEGGRDRTGRCPGDALRLKALPVEVGEGAGERDALDASAFKHEVDSLLVTHELPPNDGCVVRSQPCLVTDVR